MTNAHRIEHLNDGQVLYIAIDPDGTWARSEFPHPLVTIDYDADDNLIGISPAGSRIGVILDAYKYWRATDTRDPQQFVELLRATTAPAEAAA